MKTTNTKENNYLTEETVNLMLITTLKRRPTDKIPNEYQFIFIMYQVYMSSTNVKYYNTLDHKRLFDIYSVSSVIPSYIQCHKDIVQ